MIRTTLCAVLFSLMALTVVEADPLTDGEQALYDAMRSRLTLAGGVPVAHCRYSGHPRAMDLADPWSRCHARLAAFAVMFARAGEEHSLDPWLLLAVAIRESGLHPHAEGRIGERGIVQLHPRGVGTRSRFVSSDGYFRACRRRPDACQAEVVDIGARHLSEWIERCGSEAAGLGGYNRGRCGETGYSRRVIALRESLIDL